MSAFYYTPFFIVLIRNESQTNQNQSDLLLITYRKLYEKHDLRTDKKLSIHPTDEYFDWDKIRSKADYVPSTDDRDSIMGIHFIEGFEKQKVKDKRKKALLIQNYKHAFLKKHRFLGKLLTNTGQIIKDHYGDNIAAVYIMGMGIPRYNDYSVVKDGKWDYWMRLANKKDIGFNLKNTPFGRDDFDVIPVDTILNFLYQDMFTGLVFYKPIEEHVLKTGWEGFVDKDFEDELKNRLKIYGEIEELNWTDEQIEEMLYSNNIEEEEPYSNLNEQMKVINRWGNLPPDNWKP